MVALRLERWEVAEHDARKGMELEPGTFNRHLRLLHVVVVSIAVERKVMPLLALPCPRACVPAPPRSPLLAHLRPPGIPWRQLKGIWAFPCNIRRERGVFP